MTREEAQSLYAQGEEAVVSFLVEISGRLSSLEARLSNLSKDSHNSHKPPSSDTFKPPKSLRPMSLPSLKSGGQKGHPGQTREFASEPDAVVYHAPVHCNHCGADLPYWSASSSSEDEAVAIFAERRQVFDLPPVHFQVTEHRAQVVVCSHCQSQNKGAFPASVSAPVVYGSGLCAWVVYLHLWHLLPYARLCQLLSDLTGQSVSQGTVAGILRRAHEKLAPVEAAIAEAIVASPVAGADETKLKGAGWLHTLRTDTLTFLGCHAKRGKEAMEALGLLPRFGGTMEALGLLPRFGGTLVHDCLLGYFGFGGDHGICGAHLLRDLVFVEERFQQSWATKMKSLLLDAKDAAGKAREAGHAQIANFAALQERYDLIVEEAYKAHPPPVFLKEKTACGRQKRPKNPFWLLLLDRFRDYKRYILTFARNVQVPFDNNGSEQDIRMTKVRQKISGRFRGIDAPAWFCRIRGYLATLRKQNIEALPALKALFDGNTVMPKLA